MEFSTYSEKLNYIYYEDFIEYWLLVYKRQVFKSKYYNDIEDLKAIRDNILKNIHLENYMKAYIIEQLGLKFLLENRIGE